MKAMVVFEAQPDQTWKAVTVFQATPAHLFGKTLPGDPIREKYIAGILATVGPPRLDYTDRKGTMEDWILWAQDAMANGHDQWTSLVVPEKTIQLLYEREVVNVEPQPMSRPGLRPRLDVDQMPRRQKDCRRPVRPSSWE